MEDTEEEEMDVEENEEEMEVEDAEDAEMQVS